ncbi:hypothetical protein LX32DRAFT_260060 [Colletotrichum zoysiae]|uniref:Uncharacterized protein n=1 Tax=Colletotrichum zoysiae TaxID=1216348 RepID=A0AAD9LTJ1_9PEZI|nr:hypothetical protein LX32DRAFT_260060 [Colletotrichum zoysiae]
MLSIYAGLSVCLGASPRLAYVRPLGPKEPRSPAFRLETDVQLLACLPACLPRQVTAFLQAGFLLHCSSRAQSLMLSGAEAPAPASSPAPASAPTGLYASASDFASAHPHQAEQCVCEQALGGRPSPDWLQRTARVEKKALLLSAVRCPF